VTLRRVTSPELIKVKKEKCDLFVGSHSSWARCRNRFSQPLNIRGLNYRQRALLTAERLVPEKSAFDFELAIEKLKGQKSPGIDHISPEFIKAGGSTIGCEILKLIISVWNKEKFPEDWKELIVVPDDKGDNTDFINYSGISRLQTTYKFLSNIQLSRLTPYTEEIIGNHQCGVIIIIIMKYYLMKWICNMWTAFVWLWMWTGDGLF
jgi:hypothetical protein